MNKSYFLEGQRLGLRGVSPEDVDGPYFEWMNDQEVIAMLESRYIPQTKEALREFVKNNTSRADVLFLAIEEKTSGRHIGNIKLGPIHSIHRLGDIGIIIGDKKAWGKGYATEAIQLVSDYAFSGLNLHKLTAGCYAGNTGSQRAFERAGFVVEAVLKSHYFMNGQWIDRIEMAKWAR